MSGQTFAPEQEHAIEQRFHQAAAQFELCVTEDEARSVRAEHLRRCEAEDAAATTGEERKRAFAVRSNEYAAYKAWLITHRAASARRGRHDVA